MSKVTRRPRLPMKRERQQIDAESLSPRVRKWLGSCTISAMGSKPVWP